jgi:hypothetical protein
MITHHSPAGSGRLPDFPLRRRRVLVTDPVAIAVAGLHAVKRLGYKGLRRNAYRMA